jgi:hypothetical protein
MRTPRILGALGVLILLAAPAAAQHSSPEPRVRAAASLGGADLFRIEDRSYGRTVNVGGGVGLRVTRNLWLDIEANRFIGMEAEPAPCGLVDIVCTGGGREGYSSTTVASAGLTYHFGFDETHVALTGGIDFVRATGFATTTFGGTGQQIESSLTHSGWGPTAGISVRVPLRSGWGIEPAFRIYGADAPNLTVIRGSIALTHDF